VEFLSNLNVKHPLQESKAPLLTTDVLATVLGKTRRTLVAIHP